jgi:transcriptional regulator with XRE-family HTH domain
MTPDDLGIRIRRARERLDMSQAGLAAAVNRSVRAVGSWERGEAVPRNVIGALELVLGTDLTGDGQPSFRPDLADPAEAAIWGMTRYDAEERREAILGYRAKRRAAAATG